MAASKNKKPAKKTATLKKKKDPSVSLKKTSRGETKVVSSRPAVKTTKVSKLTAPSGKKISVKKTLPAKPSRKKPVSGKEPVAIKMVATEKLRRKGEPKKDRLQELRRELIRKREAILKEAKEEISKYMSGETRQLVDTALDEGDWAVVDISEDISLMRLAAHRKNMLDIDESLRKIDEGTYGICEECGEEISEKRLSVMPTATLCINCQGNKEQLEAIARQETAL